MDEEGRDLGGVPVQNILPTEELLSTSFNLSSILGESSTSQSHSHRVLDSHIVSSDNGADMVEEAGEPDEFLMEADDADYADEDIIPHMPKAPKIKAEIVETSSAPRNAGSSRSAKKNIVKTYELQYLYLSLWLKNC